MKHWILSALLLLTAGVGTLAAQKSYSDAAKAIQPDTTFENVLVRRLFGDAEATGFVIWIKHKVPRHMHATHGETVVILQGKAEMLLGEKWMWVRKGDIIFIPKGTAHAVTVKKGVLKVLSVQAPEFDGSDRLLLKED